MTTTNEHDKLFDLIKDTRFGMLTHRHSDGQLHSHPLTTQNKKVDEASTLYFFVPKDGDIAKHVASDGSVNVAYANTDADSYVSVTGQASLLEDQAKKNELFNPAAKAWFPKGPTDPNVGLLAVKILDAEYWDVTDSKMVQLFKIAKAAMTGDPLKDLGEHKKLNVT
ncbi:MULTISPECIES: pyridoxamine 5'-phosphate oxidase family protein [unclassified Variovorax]|jgi:general stress protein 26|uniref:pyridoxamine 5'-phosphate oxidase family protein n=1 Tax=unclassified Variovorax TaxID=663243 RepID=UPI002B238067|nr:MULTISPECIES: pyridoxamine 5'-phosphate oxidase family protein [unclassified Variovorax]MEB0057280.1 pyridoxamine 5'-phosphate oxidase family protein [Variovorax sp. LG9.2]MEB0114337.1 pyridoxamine 5'-phosphate oxidase family protein [Variovorax sp. RTB1]